jgi:hypothetical protein
LKRDWNPSDQPCCHEPLSGRGWDDSRKDWIKSVFCFLFSATTQQIRL